MNQRNPTDDPTENSWFCRAKVNPNKLKLKLQSGYIKNELICCVFIFINSLQCGYALQFDQTASLRL